MSARLHELVLRRHQLIAQASEQRAVLAATGAARVPPDRLADRALVLAGVLKRHPALGAAAVAAAGVLVLVLRRHRAALWLGRAWLAWRGWHTVQAWWGRRAAR